MNTRKLAVTLSGLISLLLVDAGVGVSPGAAAVVMVTPGVGTLQAAINAAIPGDQLHLVDGVYTGAVVVNKSLKIYCYGVADTCVIDAACSAPIAVDITADDVTLAYKSGTIIPQIIGGTTTELRVIGSDNVKLDQLQLDQSNQVPCGSETTGLEIDASSRVKVKYANSGYRAYIHNIAVGSRVSIGKSSVFFNGDDLSQPALLIENSGGGAALGKGGILINRISVQSATDGAGPNEVAIQLVNSDGVKIKGNTVSTGGTGATGIVLDATSDSNLIMKNRWADGTSGNMPYVNNGTGNCIRKNYSDAGSLPFTDSCP